MLAEPKVHLKITGREERMGWKKSRQSVSWLTGRPLCIIERRNARERENGIDNPPRHCKYICHFKTCSSTTLQSLLPFSFFVTGRLINVSGQRERERSFSGARTKEESTAFCLFGRVRDGKCATWGNVGSYQRTRAHVREGFWRFKLILRFNNSSRLSSVTMLGNVISPKACDSRPTPPPLLISISLFLFLYPPR